MMAMTLKEKERLYEKEIEKTACLVNDLMCIFSNIGVSEKSRIDHFVETVRGKNDRSGNSGGI